MSREEIGRGCKRIKRYCRDSRACKDVVEVASVKIGHAIGVNIVGQRREAEKRGEEKRREKSREKSIDNR